MPMDWSRYPKNWPEISRRIRFERAGGKCEECGAPHNGMIVRSKRDPARYLVYHPDGYFSLPDGTVLSPLRIPDHYPVDQYPGAYTRVILTTHHIGVDKPDGSPGDPHDKMDVREENLAALCQRCHFIADLPIHIQKARESRIRKREESRRAGGWHRLPGLE